MENQKRKNKEGKLREKKNRMPLIFEKVKCLWDQRTTGPSLEKQPAATCLTNWTIPGIFRTLCTLFRKYSPLKCGGILVFIFLFTSSLMTQLSTRM